MRMLIVGYGYGIRTERRLCEEVHLNLAYRGKSSSGIGSISSPSTRPVLAWMRQRSFVLEHLAEVPTIWKQVGVDIMMDARHLTKLEFR
jgi:hypothetical protein